MYFQFRGEVYLVALITRSKNTWLFSTVFWLLFDSSEAFKSEKENLQSKQTIKDDKMKMLFRCTLVKG